MLEVVLKLWVTDANDNRPTPGRGRSGGSSNLEADHGDGGRAGVGHLDSRGFGGAEGPRAGPEPGRYHARVVEDQQVPRAHLIVHEMTGHAMRLALDADAI